MSSSQDIYCLDANVLIQAWQKYYSPTLCPSYWEILNDLGAAERIFMPAAVREEITRTEDDLADWVKQSDIPVQAVTGPIALALKRIYAHDKAHETLADNSRGRSLADPWVIATALATGACVVTKEEMVTAVNTSKIKIPNVCRNMGVRCINDFDFLAEMGARFSCQYNPKGG